MAGKVATSTCCPSFLSSTRLNHGRFLGHRIDDVIGRGLAALIVKLYRLAFRHDKPLATSAPAAQAETTYVWSSKEYSVLYSWGLLA